jgi:type IV secretory pathway VirB10-like protein
MKIKNLPALLATLCALALTAAGCQRQSAEQTAQATEPRVAQTTPSPVPQTAPPATTESYVIEEPGRTSSPVSPVSPVSPASPPPAVTEHRAAAPPPAVAEKRDVEPPPAVSERPERSDVERPTRTVAPPAKAPKQQPRQEPKANRERRLDSRERRLAERQAELDARERRLRRREAPRRTEVPVPDQPAESEPVPEPAPDVVPERPQPEPATPVTVDAGTKLDVRFSRSLSSATSTVGEIFRARIAEDLYAGDRVAIPAGSEVVGEVTQAGPSKKIGGRAVLGLRFTDIVLPSGETVPLKASFQREGQNKSGRDAATIGGATAGGAILGRILSKGGGKGTVLGAIIGAAAGAAIASRNPGEEVVIPEGSVLGIVLDRPVEVQGRR